MKRKSYLVSGILAAALAAGLLTGCGPKGSDPALTVNGEVVSTAVANTYLRFAQAESTNMMMQFGMFGSSLSNLWDDNTLVSDSAYSTYGEQFKDGIKDEIVTMVAERQQDRKSVV